ncbi:hypothetical protein B0T24DRAFT_636411 [Lasiosphaeria ovina]|uniref:Uncharacterized protein n=1 Tax=Lasiosphaeria ovina TaxID=92902 RepID=A0AAE0JWK4_9PEZI|nr:hypothetical protein B0T24DRAFT_636411 [Lasiosphaeria ovina]
MSIHGYVIVFFFLFLLMCCMKGTYRRSPWTQPSSLTRNIYHDIYIYIYIYNELEVFLLLSLC